MSILTSDIRSGVPTQQVSVAHAVVTDDRPPGVQASDLPVARRLGYHGAPAVNAGLTLPPSGRRFGVQLVNDTPADEPEFEDEYTQESRRAAELQAAEAATIDTFRRDWSTAVASGREQQFLAGLQLGVAAPALTDNPTDAERYWARITGLVRLAELPDLDARIRPRLVELGRQLLADPAFAAAMRQDFEVPLARQFGESDFSIEPRWLPTAAQLVSMTDKLGITPRTPTEQLTYGYALIQLSHGIGDSMGVSDSTLTRYGADPRRGAWGFQQSLLQRMRALPIVQNAAASSDGARLGRTIDTFVNSRNGGWQRLSDPSRAERFIAGSLDGKQVVTRADIDQQIARAGDALEDELLHMTEAQRARIFSQVWTIGVNLGALSDGRAPTAYVGNSWLRTDRMGEAVLPTQATFDPARPAESIAALRAELEARVRRRLDSIERQTSAAGQRLAYFEMQITWPQFVRGGERMFEGQVIVPQRAGDVVDRAAGRRGGNTVGVR